MRALRQLREVVLTVGAVLGTLCLISLITLVGLGVRPLIVRSGSMEPSISTGALALAQERPASRVQVGDVVSVPTEAGVRVTHRVVAVDRDGRGVKLTLQGDANDVPDAEPYLVTTVDRVVADVPLAGYVVAWGAGPVGRFLLGAFMGVVLLLGVGGRNRLAPAEVTPPPAHAVTRAPTPPTPVGRLRRRVRRTLRWTARLSAATCVTIGAVVTPAGAASAAYVNSGTVTSGSFAAYTVPAPVISSCEELPGTKVRVYWPGITSPFALGYSGLIVEDNVTLAVVTSGSNRYVEVAAGLLAALISRDITIRVRANLATTPVWTSPPADQRLRVGLLGLSLSCL